MYTKITHQKEAQIYKIASDNGISPKITSIVEIESSVFKLGMKLYPIVLINVIESDRYRYQQKIMDKVSELHQLGILWIDIHEENVVIDEFDNVKLIDFGFSIFEHEFNPDLTIKWFDEECSNSENIDDCLTFHKLTELEEIKLICCNL